ncbi:hypothetical protein E2C01_054808 [Portunus trituberculatus]|uniref:Integrase zinc-binding domain-containing protein n=1 Tax=Portunus trituberculatus TaxID=210409 RepID=A0A5B7GPL5_PORTR|nr:hypothetical protein [Portunus trituberculatus]
MEERLPVYVADVGESLLGLDYFQRSRAVPDFGEITMAVGGNVVPLQESGDDAVEREVSIETHQAHTVPSPKASQCCRLDEEQEDESLRPGGCEGVQTTMDPEGHSEDTQGRSTEILPHLRELLQRIKALWQQWSVLCLSEGVPQRCWESCDGGVAFWQTIVPTNRREALVREAHGGSASGHFGVRKTLGRSKQHVY